MQLENISITCKEKNILQEIYAVASKFFVTKHNEIFEICLSEIAIAVITPFKITIMFL